MDELIAMQQKLLHAHRQTLAAYLHRLALVGVANAPPEVINGIAAARQYVVNVDELLKLAQTRVTRQLTPEERIQFGLAPSTN